MARAKERHQPKGATSVANQATSQKTGEQQSTAYKKLTTVSGNKMPRPIGMDKIHL